jgi:hypothetical protein
MNDRDFTTAFTVDQTPEEVFAAINNVRGWWTGKPGVEGSTDTLGDEFTYRYEDVHYSKQKVTELIPGRKVVWLVLDANLGFTRDKAEWKGTKVTFEISRKGARTEVRFTHVGLVPEFECFDACSNAWGSYVMGSLWSLIANSKGATPREDTAVRPMNGHNFATAFTVDQAPEDVFAAIKNVRGWWSEEIEGSSDKVNGEFAYRYEDVHRCKIRVTELIPGKKVTWLVLDNYFNFTRDKSEWKGTEIIFEISEEGKTTELRFTHRGLVPEYECFDVCSNAWGSYIKGSLRSLIATGKGKPNQKNR